mmetsp:Transcript_64421/g.114572  ORF Transcript_64421/g.114572 Transcript_64421/m.114572 type:complete len:106 (+) Transcript_64421:44-361(+)
MTGSFCCIVGSCWMPATHLVPMFRSTFAVSGQRFWDTQAVSQAPRAGSSGEELSASIAGLTFSTAVEVCSFAPPTSDKITGSSQSPCAPARMTTKKSTWKNMRKT